MKASKSRTRLIAALALLFCASRAYALFGVGDIVFDPSAYGAIITSHVETLAKFAEQIKAAEDQILNQKKQIEEAQRLFNIQNELRVQIGDWQGVFDKAQAIKLSLRDITEAKFDTKVSNLLTLDYGQPGISRSGPSGGEVLYSNNAFNIQVNLPRAQSNRFIAADKAYDNVYRVYSETEQPIADLRRDLGETY